MLVPYITSVCPFLRPSFPATFLHLAHAQQLSPHFRKGRVVLDDQVFEVDIVPDRSTMRREGIKVAITDHTPRMIISMTIKTKQNKSGPRDSRGVLQPINPRPLRFLE